MRSSVQGCGESAKGLVALGGGVTETLALRFGSWNIRGARTVGPHVELIRGVGCDLLALQEVSTRGYEELAASGLFARSAFSLDLRPPSREEGRRRHPGCALFCREPHRLASVQLIDAAPLPERTLVARVRLGRGILTAASFHIPPGSTWGNVKVEAFKAIAAWLGRKRSRLVFGIDANAPKSDRPDIAENTWWRDGEHLVLGERPAHRLRDVLRAYLADHPRRLRKMLAERPGGPLEVSYDRGRRGKPVLCRYDFIFATPDVKIGRVRYLYEESRRAGSDHALVVADLELPISR